MNHLMLGLETLGKKPSAPILTIGAVLFNPHSGELGEQFYTAPPTPAVVDKPSLPPHVYRDLLDMLQEAAIAYGGTQQLRAQLSYALSIHVQPDHPHTRASMLAQPISQRYTLPPHVFRELVNSLRYTAVKYQGNQQLREQLKKY
ncbi:3'-5' exoribonuclease [Serratia nematodiphila]